MANGPEELPLFSYTPLAPGEIRLLVPDPSRADDGLFWKLRVTALNSDLVYETLSYAWGSQVHTYPISCNGHQLRVHHNLYKALPYLARRHDRTVISTLPIWIDAVCINQGDEDEKFVQINIMNQIYKRAKKVWAWISLAADQHKLSVLLSLLPSIVTYNKQISQRTQQAIPARPAELQKIDITYRDTIFHLFCNPWFYRVWVVQEASLAKDMAFLCGDHEIDFVKLEEASDTQSFSKWTWYDATGQAVPSPHMSVSSQALFDTRTFFRSQKNYEGDTVACRPLRVVLLMIPNFDCFAPQDRIFGMMGLLKEMDPEILDFSDNVSIPSLYTSFTRYLFAISDTNQYWWRYFNLSFNLRRTEGLPSWVPDLHFQRSPYVCLPPSVRQFQRSVNNRYQASLRPVSVKFGHRRDEIILHGKILDSVLFVHPPSPSLHRICNPQDYSPIDREDSAEHIIGTFVDLDDWLQTVATTVLSESTTKLSSTTSPTIIPVSRDTFWCTLMGGNETNDDPDDVEPILLTEETWTDFSITLRQFAAVYRKMQRYFSPTFLPIML